MRSLLIGGLVHSRHRLVEVKPRAFVGGHTDDVVVGRARGVWESLLLPDLGRGVLDAPEVQLAEELAFPIDI